MSKARLFRMTTEHHSSEVYCYVGILFFVEEFYEGESLSVKKCLR